jgi:hypothetical protein
MSLPLVLFFHRLGVKLYSVPENEDITELVEITSVNPSDIIENLSEYRDKEIYLLASDSICHVFHHELPHQTDQLTREFVFDQVKDKFPSHLQSSNWDFKVISTDTRTIEIIVFALNDEFQSLIASVISELSLKVLALEPESIAVTRHSNPIVGITFGKTIRPSVQNETASDTVRIDVASQSPSSPINYSRSKVFLVFLGLAIFIYANYFLYQKYNQSLSIATATLTPTVSLSPTPSPIVQKTWSSLSLLIENGTTKAGYAGSIAVKFQEEGIVDIKTGNAPRSDYSTSKLTFKSSSLKDSYYQRFNKIFPVSEPDTLVNPDLQTDVVLTLGSL